MKPKNKKLNSYARYVIIALITVTFCAGVAVFVLNKFAGTSPRSLFLNVRNAREKKNSKQEKQRIEYHAMVAEKIFADNIEKHLK